MYNLEYERCGKDQNIIVATFITFYLDNPQHILNLVATSKTSIVAENFTTWTMWGLHVPDIACLEQCVHSAQLSILLIMRR